VCRQAEVIVQQETTTRAQVQVQQQVQAIQAKIPALLQRVQIQADKVQQLQAQAAASQEVHHLQILRAVQVPHARHQHTAAAVHQEVRAEVVMSAAAAAREAEAAAEAVRAAVAAAAQEDNFLDTRN